VTLSLISYGGRKFLYYRRMRTSLRNSGWKNPTGPPLLFQISSVGFPVRPPNESNLQSMPVLCVIVGYTSRQFLVTIID